MWLWLQNMRPQSHKQFWYYVAVSCLTGHLMFLMFSFRYHGQKPLDLTVFANARATEVIFLPAYKKIPGAQSKLAQGRVGKPAVGDVKKSVGQGARRVKTGVAVAKRSKLDTYAVPSKTVPVKHSKKLDIGSKSKSSGQVQVKNKTAQPVESVAASKPEEPVKAVKQPLKIIDQVEPVAVPEPVGEEVNEPILIGLGTDGAIALGREDLAAWQAAQELESVIVQSWRPPTGFSKELVCQVQLMVDSQGHVASFEIKKGSGVLAYDLSIRQALPKLIFPKTVQNKILIISFKQ